MNRSFGALHGLAIVIVVLYHSVVFSMEPPRYDYTAPTEGWIYYVQLSLQQLGIFAVPTFLFISGCFFSYAAQRYDSIGSMGKVVVNGLKHLLWPYVIWSVIFYLMLYLLWQESSTPLEYLKNLVVGFPYHFVPLIVFYYILSPLLIFIARRLFSGILLILAIAIYQLILISPVLFPGIFPAAWINYLVPPVLRTTLTLWAIFFPLGLVYSLNASRIMPWLEKLKWILLAVAVLFYVVSILDILAILHFPLAQFISPIAFVLFTPTIQRNAIPQVRQLEKIGKRSYGLYLSHLVVINCILIIIELVVPWLFNYQLLLVAILFTTTLATSLGLMNGFAQLPKMRPAYRYVFG
jgi:peptidoglycan/LPS O-acetylase OafA/YrhL